MKVRLRQQSVTIGASRSLVFELISSFGGQDGGEETAILMEREGNRLLMEFHSRDGRKTYRTLEEVTLYPEERITFKHLEGPLHYSQEEFVFTQGKSGTLITHNGAIECRMHWLPGAGWVVARFYVKSRYERLVLRHMNNLKAQAEGQNLG